MSRRNRKSKVRAHQASEVQFEARHKQEELSHEQAAPNAMPVQALDPKLQIPGIGISLVSATVFYLWPQQQTLAIVGLVLGLVLTVLPLLAWSLRTIGKSIGARSPIDLKSPMRSTVTARETAVAALVLIGFAAASIFVVAEAQAVRTQKAQQETRLALQESARTKRLADVEKLLAQLDLLLRTAKELVTRKVLTDEELYPWLQKAGAWEQAIHHVYDQAIAQSVLTPLSKQEFEGVRGEAIGGSYNLKHGQERGFMVTRIDGLRENIKRIETELARLRAEQTSAPWVPG